MINWFTGTCLEHAMEVKDSRCGFSAVIPGSGIWDLDGTLPTQTTKLKPACATILTARFALMILSSISS
jgi:hypothetical protein